MLYCVIIAPDRTDPSSKYFAHENNTTIANRNDGTILANDTTPSSSNSENNEKSKFRKRRCFSKIYASNNIYI